MRESFNIYVHVPCSSDLKPHQPERQRKAKHLFFEHAVICSSGYNDGTTDMHPAVPYAVFFLHHRSKPLFQISKLYNGCTERRASTSSMRSHRRHRQSSIGPARKPNMIILNMPNSQCWEESSESQSWPCRRVELFAQIKVGG